MVTMSDEVMGKLEFATPKEAWGGEASDFTPALADRLDYLGSVCGLGPLESVGVEQPSGTRRIDVLASLDDRKVVIENQYGSADHDHLTRGLAYAVAQEASALIVVAEHHRDEFVAVAEYLNDRAALGEGGIAVWLVEVRATRRVGDDVWSPLFDVRAQPNQWEQGVKAAAANEARSRHTLTTVDEFTELTEHPDVVRELIDRWTQHEGASAVLGLASNPTVQLRHPDPAHPHRGHACFTLYAGALWLNVTYVRDASGAFTSPDDLAELEAAARHAFPVATARFPDELPGYLVIGLKDVEGHLEPFGAFADWLCDWLQERLGE